jgi:hypothetical protein
MYIEFVISYVLLAILVVLLTVVIILQCVILKKIARGGGGRSQNMGYNPYSVGNAYAGGSRGAAICRNCATQFDAAHTICPKCGTPR